MSGDRNAPVPQQASSELTLERYEDPLPYPPWPLERAKSVMVEGEQRGAGVGFRGANQAFVSFQGLVRVPPAGLRRAVRRSRARVAVMNPAIRPQCNRMADAFVEMKSDFHRRPCLRMSCVIPMLEVHNERLVFSDELVHCLPVVEIEGKGRMDISQ